MDGFKLLDFQDSCHLMLLDIIFLANYRSFGYDSIKILSLLACWFGGKDFQTSVY